MSFLPLVTLSGDSLTDKEQGKYSISAQPDTVPRIYQYERHDFVPYES
jgi:hypothetical protein